MSRRIIRGLRMQHLSILPLQSFDDYNTPEGGVGFISLTYFDTLFGNSLDLSIMAITVTSADRSIAIKCMPHDEDEDIIYLPDWAREYLGDGTAQINKIDLDATPVAQTIRARVIDNEMYHVDIKEELEKLLSNFKFIQANIVLAIEIDSMGGYPATIWIEEVFDEEGTTCVGPAQLGDEVRLDMGEPLERAPEFEPSVVPVPEPVPVPVPEPELVVPEPIEELSVQERTRIAREARLKRFA